MFEVCLMVCISALKLGLFVSLPYIFHGARTDYFSIEVLPSKKALKPASNTTKVLMINSNYSAISYVKMRTK
jgi:hypothetical protein